MGIHSARNVINTEHKQLSEVSRNYGVKACHVAVQMPCKTETQSVSCSNDERAVSNCSEGVYKEIGNHVNDLVKSKTVSSVAYLAAPQETNVSETETRVQCTLGV